MIRSILTLLLLSAGTQATAQACGTADLIAELTPEDRARLDAYVAPHAYPEGILFQAEKPGSTVTVVGTIHLPDPRLAPIVDQVRPSLESADLLILEASAEDEMAIQGFAATKPELFFITEGPTLIDLLSEEEWAQVTDRLGQIGLPSVMAAQFQPWYLSMMMAIPPCAMATMQAGQKGLDRQLEVLAQDQDLPLATLDDTEAILRIFAEEPIETQLDGLRLSLETQAEGNASTSTLIEAYFDGRIRESWEYGRILMDEAEVENGAEIFEEVNQALLIDRNASWEEQFPDLLAGKDVVIAVGAAHLSGESGVLRALERLGYEISPL